MSSTIRRKLMNLFLKVIYLKDISNYRPSITLNTNEKIILYPNAISYTIDDDYYMFRFTLNTSRSGLDVNEFKSDNKMLQFDIYGGEFSVVSIGQIIDMDDVQLTLAYGKFDIKPMGEEYENIFSRCEILMDLLVEKYSDPEKIFQLKMSNVVCAS